MSFEPLNQANSRFGLLHTVRFMPERDWGKVGNLFQCQLTSQNDIIKKKEAEMTLTHHIE